MKKLLTFSVLLLFILSCNTTSSEVKEIPEKYHGVWSTSYTTDGGVDVESYLDISSKKIIHHLEDELNQCFFEKTVYNVESVEGNTINTDGATFRFSEPQEQCDDVECWTGMEVTSSAIYDDEGYTLNSQPIAFTPQCD